VVLGTRRKNKGEEHPDTILAMTRLSLTYLLQGKLERGSQILEEVLAKQQKMYGRNNQWHGVPCKI
jgi:hypothetical protein